MMDKRLVNANELVSVAKHLRRTGTYYVAGSNTVSVPSYGIKYLDEAAVKPWPNLQNEPEPMTPGEAARTELGRAFPGLRRVGWSGPMIKLLDKRPPMHYTGPAVGEFVYLDLKSAYWQLYRPLWLDTSWPRGYRGKYPLYGVADRLEKWKPARNAVIGIARSRYVWGQRGDKRLMLSFTNHYLSPGLWATVMDMVHWIARRAIFHGAIYVNTDGYMFRADNVHHIRRFQEWLERKHLVYELRAEGQGEIRSWNSYKVGSYQTKPYRLGLIHKTKEFSNVHKRPLDWGQYRRNVVYLVRTGKGRTAERSLKRENDLRQDQSGE